MTTHTAHHNTEKTNQAITEAYDKQTYTSNAFAYSSPNHLRAAALLYGLDSVPLENARVLELGCAAGGNLLPFATAYPNAQVVGVDLSEVQISQGKEAVNALDLTNLSLHAMSFSDIDASFGQFDYIIAHGVFSWIPPEVRQAMLQLLRAHLSPQGLAYISYNTYPGWKAGDIVRDAILLHSHNTHSEEDKLAAAKAALNLLSEGIANSNSLRPSLLAATEQLRKQSDYYIAHEYLELFNSPCYLVEFASMAQEFGMIHVGDSEPHIELAATYGQNVQLNHSLIAMGQPRIMRQQYLDFSVGRNFRKSLVVHQEQEEKINSSPNLDRLNELRWAGYFTKTNSPEGAAKEVSSYNNHKNRTLHTSDAAVLAVVHVVTAVWPRSLSFDALLEACEALLPKENGKTPQEQLLSALQALFNLNSLRYYLEPNPYDNNDKHSENPCLIPSATWLYTKKQQDANFGIGMFNLGHDTVGLQLNEAQAWLLPHINGEHNPKQLTILLRDALTRGTVPGPNGQSLKGQRNLDSTADKIVTDLLRVLKPAALIY